MDSIVKSKLLFILIGDDRTGKTTFQKLLIDKICKKGVYGRLPVNLRFDIKHPEIKRKYQTIFFANRSYQENKENYGSVDDYFKNDFKSADIAIISSHLNITDIADMLRNGRENFYNVVGVFFRNSIQNDRPRNSQISILDWNERLIIENRFTEDEQSINKQLENCVENFVIFLANRTSIS